MFIFLQDLPVYSSEEKAMMAEILRDDQLKERRENARNMVFSYYRYVYISSGLASLL